MNLKISKSFEEWCIENNRNDLLIRWNYELNKCNPNEIGYSSNKEYYFNCCNEIHTPELKKLSYYTKRLDVSMKCKQCNSFAYWGIINFGEDFLTNYWDYGKNNDLEIDPWNLSYSSAKKVWIKCQNKIEHESYLINAYDFILGNRCSYCSGKKIHINDSFGQYIINNFDEDFLHNIWSDKNEKSPFEYFPKSHQKVWWKCIDCKHDDFKRSLDNSYVCDFRCPKCKSSKGEKRIEKYLIKNHILYNTQKFFNELKGVKGRVLLYDFYLPNQNILIEYQGEFHDGKAKLQTEEGYITQQEHDKRKREYALKQNIKLLEIWYWDFDRIEEILSNEINNLNENIGGIINYDKAI